MPNNITILTIKQLISKGCKYEIPIYQRNYAWGEKEIVQLIHDIIDYTIKEKDKNYYIGTLVVAKQNNEYYDTIDGQQRLTTLNILSAVLKNEEEYNEVDMSWFINLNLSFASREKSMNTLQEVFNGEFLIQENEVNITKAYQICKRELKKICQDSNISYSRFANYLFEKVQILRVPLPDGTDLNHYFEIMNSRGEQLEKHEVLKAKLMSSFNHLEKTHQIKYTNTFHKIWEACANMEKYVQYGFEVEERHQIFGKNDWNNLIVDDFETITERLTNNITSTEDNPLSIQTIIKNPIISENELEKRSKKSEDNPDRFYPIINFQNFLLHVLKVQTKSSEVQLDDKKLINAFENELTNNIDENLEFVKTFIYNLLRCKFLFDKYIIKKQVTSKYDGWSLQSLSHYSSANTKNAGVYKTTFSNNKNDENYNHRVLMLLAMFHVSLPSFSYKYWLNAAMQYLFDQIEVEEEEYLKYLEHIAKKFVFDRHLAKREAAEYYEMIYNQKVKTRSLEDLDLSKLNYRNIQNNLVFNFLDYLLWLKLRKIESDSRVRNFKFTARSSREHFYPQNPLNIDVLEMDEEVLHSFGNLCLISHSKNSKYSNYLPIAKVGQYDSNEELDSIKQFLMMKEASHWWVNEVNAHNHAMIKVFEDNLNSNFSYLNKLSETSKMFIKYRNSNPILLVQALLCFEDYTKNLGNHKYNFLNFDYMKKSVAFTKMQQFVTDKKITNLSEIVNYHIENKLLIHDFRYLFVKYPNTLNYCKTGNFIYKKDGKLIYLLKDFVFSKNKSKEMFSFIVRQRFKKDFGIHFGFDQLYIWLKIGYKDNKYFISSDDSEPGLFLYFWNNKGENIQYSLEKDNGINGNNAIIQKLKVYKWTSMEDYYLRNERSKLLNLNDDFNANIDNYYSKIISTLKNGFGIKIK